MAKDVKGSAVAGKPAAPDVPPKPKKPGRVAFPQVGNKDEKIYPFDVAMPEGFNWKQHKSLKKRDYTADHLFYEFRALECDHKAILFRAQAEESQKLGSAKDRGRAKRLIKLQEKMAELKSQLTAQGVDVEELLLSALAT